MKALALIAILLFASAVTAKEHDWKTAKVISQTISSDNAGTAIVPIGGTVVAAPIRRTSNTVVIETSGLHLTLLEKPGKHYLVLTENGDTQFYEDGRWFVFLDVEHKEHKFSLVHSEKL
jgi:hypothetical protein